MRLYYFKAYDGAGRRIKGTIEASDPHAADQELRQTGLRPYFVRDYRALKRSVHRRNRRVRIMTVVGAILAGLSLVLAGAIVGYAGRERAPQVADLREAEPVEGSPIPLAVKTDAEREFALDIYNVWQSFCPNAVTAIEVSKFLMTIDVTRGIRTISGEELEMLASATVQAHSRRFRGTSFKLFVVEEGLTILETDYIGLTGTISFKHYK